MDFIIISFAIYIFIYFFFSLGYFVNNKISVLENKNFIDFVIFGYSLFIIFSFHSYFILNLKNEYLLFSILLFFLYFHFEYRNLINLKIIFKYFVIILFFLLFFYIPVKLYGEQFYVFRGNYWDNFNYLSSALLFNKFSYYDVNNPVILNNFKNFQSIESIIAYRPFINYFLSLFLYIKSLDIFFINFFFKIFLSIINFLAFISFLEIFKKIKENYKIALSFVLSFSFFSLYVFEIEALSHLGSISLFLISIKYLYLFIEKKNYKRKSYIFFLSILNASLFIMYPEIFIFYGIISFAYLASNLNLLNYKILITNVFYCSLLFLLLTISSFEINYKYLIMQFSQALNPDIDWWTYFGAFIFGKDNLVLDINYISLIQENLIKNNIFELIKMFYFDHLERGYKFIFINIIPSFFGFYYLTEGKINSYMSYFMYLISLFLNGYIIFILIKNLKFIFQKKLKVIIVPTILILFFIFYLAFNGSFWTIIKIYSYSLIFIFIMISINFKNENFNKIILILLLLFPFYKYSANNFGIGVFDSFPSIINKEYKKKINWNLNKKNLDFCENIYTLENDYFVRAYINIKSLYNNKNFVHSIGKKNKNKVCEVSVRNKSFVVISHK